MAAAVTATLSIGMAVHRHNGQQEVTARPGAGAAEPDLNEIIGKLEQKLKQDPASGEGWRLLGLSYAAANRNADAARAYRRAVEINPRRAELWSALGEALVLTDSGGVSDEALAAFNKAVAIDPNDVRARFFLGESKAARGDAKGAIEDWQALVREYPADAPWVAMVRQRIDAVTSANAIGPEAPVAENGS